MIRLELLQFRLSGCMIHKLDTKTEDEMSIIMMLWVVTFKHIGIQKGQSIPIGGILLLGFVADFILLAIYLVT